MKRLFLYLFLLLTPVVSGQILTGVVASSQGTSCNENLFTWSEVIDPSTHDDWYAQNATIVQNQSNDLLGNATLEQITTTSTTAYLEYYGTGTYNTVTPSTTYYLSFDCTRGTMSELTYGVYDITHSVTLVDATSYYSQTAGAVQRVSLSFATTAGCTEIIVYPLFEAGVTGTVFLGRMQLTSNGSCYITTTTLAITP